MGRTPRPIIGIDDITGDDVDDNVIYMSWIRANDAEFRKAHGLTGDYVPMSMMDEFTAYLWGEG